MIIKINAFRNFLLVHEDLVSSKLFVSFINYFEQSL